MYADDPPTPPWRARCPSQGLFVRRSRLGGSAVALGEGSSRTGVTVPHPNLVPQPLALPCFPNVLGALLVLHQVFQGPLGSLELQGSGTFPGGLANRSEVGIRSRLCRSLDSGSRAPVPCGRGRVCLQPAAPSLETGPGWVGPLPLPQILQCCPRPRWGPAAQNSPVPAALCTCSRRTVASQKKMPMFCQLRLCVSLCQKQNGIRNNKQTSSLAA